MSGTIEKANFLRNKLVPELGKISAARKPAWGKMNFHQMVEHMTDAFKEANGRVPRDLMTPDEHIGRMQDFLMSEKPFRENTPNKLLPDEPPAPKHETVEASLEELKEEIEHFFDVFGSEPSKKITNPFFGVLGYEQWVQLLHKHSLHHLKQFGVE